MSRVGSRDHHTKWRSKILLYKVHAAVNRVHGVKKWTSSFIINWSKVVCGFCHTLRLLRIFFSKASFFHYILYELSWKFIDGSQKSSCHVITYFRSQWTICYAVKSFLWLKFGDKKQVNQYFWNTSKWQKGPASSPASLFHSEKKLFKKWNDIILQNWKTSTSFKRSWNSPDTRAYW